MSNTRSGSAQTGGSIIYQIQHRAEALALGHVNGLDWSFLASDLRVLADRLERFGRTSDTGGEEYERLCNMLHQLSGQA